MDLAKNGDGNVLEDAENWSLKYIMASCLDFAEELTALQYVARPRTWCVRNNHAKVPCRVGRRGY